MVRKDDRLVRVVGSAYRCPANCAKPNQAYEQAKPYRQQGIPAGMLVKSSLHP